jgi:hypothetical protein
MVLKVRSPVMARPTERCKSFNHSSVTVFSMGDAPIPRSNVFTGFQTFWPCKFERYPQLWIQCVLRDRVEIFLSDVECWMSAGADRIDHVPAISGQQHVHVPHLDVMGEVLKLGQQRLDFDSITFFGPPISKRDCI